MADEVTEVQKLRAELAKLREFVYALPASRQALERERFNEKQRRLCQIDNLADLIALDLGDRNRLLDQLGADRVTSLLRGADPATIDSVLLPASRMIRCHVRANLTPPDRVPRHVLVSARKPIGGLGFIEISAKAASDLIAAGVGSWTRDLQDQRRYCPPALSATAGARWPIAAWELLRRHWGEAGGLVVVPCSLDEDRAALAQDIL